MKLALDEKIKHRIIGIAVLVSIAVILLPAAYKQSAQKKHHELSMNIKLPSKPQVHELARKDEQAMFKEVKLARVTLEEVPLESQLPKLSRAKPLHQHQPISVIAEQKNLLPDVKEVNTAKSQESKVQVSTKQAKKNSPDHKSAKNAATDHQYSVQLAVFSHINNANALKKALDKKGYNAKIANILVHGKNMYKLYVGSVEKRDKAVQLKQQLAENFNLEGIVVKGVA